MAKFIEAECPKCKAAMKFPDHLEKVFCSRCGSEFIVAEENYVPPETKKVKTCPYCSGKRVTICTGIRADQTKGVLRSFELFAESCTGTGKCMVYCYPEMMEPISNYCNHGKCAWCKGTGKVYLRTCRFCEGTGNCRFCHGSGKCIICNGKGEIRCKACDGRGVMPHQKSH
ncbi:MAG: hypothetical protein JSV09_08525 [Thermoplasmata archaeon]|nr:MAG: hypothetical protein JSV09_08525 [Thermoplasmata archaeon]